MSANIGMAQIVKADLKFELWKSDLFSIPNTCMFTALKGSQF